MSLINLLKKKNKFLLFTTPSHSQRFFIFNKLRQFYKYDISEVDAYKPEDALDLCEKQAAKIYGTKATKFLTNGSTSGVIAAVLACVKQGESVLIWDKAHRCHKNAVKLAGATPVFYQIEKISDWDIFGSTPPDNIEKELKSNSKIKAVIVTSPSYNGIISDIKEIKKVCEKYGCYLIVDEAHGALYPFCDELPTSAIELGADFVIQSLHKTAGGLNPTALLHTNTDLNVAEALEIISTTSPSYPMLASIEKNINYLNSKKGRAEISELVKNIENLKQDVKNVEFFETNNEITHDPTKILIKSEKHSGVELSEILFNKYKIEDEITNEKSTMLLCGLGTGIEKLEKLKKTLKKL